MIIPEDMPGIGRKVTENFLQVFEIIFLQNKIITECPRFTMKEDPSPAFKNYNKIRVIIFIKTQNSCIGCIEFRKALVKWKIEIPVYRRIQSACQRNFYTGILVGLPMINVTGKFTETLHSSFSSRLVSNPWAAINTSLPDLTRFSKPDTSASVVNNDPAIQM